MSGEIHSAIVPLHLTALEQHGNSMIEWVHSWFGGDGTWLTPNDWFTVGHTSMSCIWTPPPTAADVAMEQLSQSIHKRPQHMHLVIVPRLMTFQWRKLLGKICDLVFTIPLGTEPWNTSQHEPLIVALYFPLSRHEPWRLWETPMLEHIERSLHDGAEPVTP
jgi:hypothetical protein